MKKKQWTALLLICCLIAALFAGCGTRQTVTEEEPQTSPTEEMPTEKPEDTPQEETPAEEPQEEPAEEPQEEPASGTEGVEIPALKIEVPKEDNVIIDMVGLIVYHGGIYTQAQYYEGDKAEALMPLVGEQLGTAIGSLDEWSSQEEYAVECASTIAGPFYAMEGYDEDFRICMTGTYEDDGRPYLWTFERLNGITLSDGGDLFEDRLRIPGRYRSVEWLSHDDWNNARNENRKALDLPSDTIDWFLEALCAGPFVDVYSKDPDFYDDDKIQAHLYITLEDGTEVELRLMEGGYVGYQPLGWYFVGMEGEAFDAVFMPLTGCTGLPLAPEE